MAILEYKTEGSYIRNGRNRRGKKRGHHSRYGRRRRRSGLGWGIALVIMLLLFLAAALVVKVWQTRGDSGEEQRGSELVTEGEKENPDVTPVFGGAELVMLQNQSKGQMMSFLLETKDGNLIVIDGGRWEDGDYLCQQIQARGGRVTAWFLTHTHTDHVGALLKILQNQEEGIDPGIEIDDIYYNFASRDWYALHEPDDMGTAWTIIDLLEGLPGEKLHRVKRQDVIQVDDVTVTVMNDRYEPGAEQVGDNDGNDCGIAYRMVVNGVSLLFLGDLGVTGGRHLMEQAGPDGLKSDMVQMAHHGQDGVEEAVYQAVDPSVCLWPTPQWLWDNENGQFKTPETKEWVSRLKVQKHYCTKDGDQIIR